MDKSLADEVLDYELRELGYRPPPPPVELTPQQRHIQRMSWAVLALAAVALVADICLGDGDD